MPRPGLYKTGAVVQGSVDVEKLIALRKMILRRYAPVSTTLG